MGQDVTLNVEILNVGQIFEGGVSWGLQTLAGADTLALEGNSGVARVTAAAARTGGIFPVGTKHGQRLTIFHEGAAANTWTLAAAGTSNAAGGITYVLAGLEVHQFIWNSSTALWYIVGPAAN